MIFTLLACVCAGFGLADGALSVRIAWRVAHGERSADLRLKLVDEHIVNSVWLVGIALLILGRWVGA